MSAEREIAAERRKTVVSSRLPHTRLHCGDLFSDIVEDRRGSPPLVICVVQKKGSSEILFLAQFRSFPEALLAGRRLIRDGRAQAPLHSIDRELANTAASAAYTLRRAQSVLQESQRIVEGALTLIRQSRELTRTASKWQHHHAA